MEQPAMEVDQSQSQRYEVPTLVDLKGLGEAMDALGVPLPKKTLLNWAQNGSIPSLAYAGRRRLFSVPAVHQAILERAAGKGPVVVTPPPKSAIAPRAKLPVAPGSTTVPAPLPNNPL
jgi:hypothetical protein